MPPPPELDVLEPPAITETPTQTAPEVKPVETKPAEGKKKDIKDFTPEPFSLEPKKPDDDQDEEQEEEILEVKTDTPPVESDKEKKKVENKNLRTELERVTREELPKLKTTLAEREAELAAARKELAETKQKIEEVERTPAQPDNFNPWQTPEVRAITAPYESAVNDLSEEINAMSGKGTAFQKELPNLIDQYQKIGKLGSEGFDDRQAAFREAIEDKFGSDHIKDITKIVVRGAKVSAEAYSKAEELKANAGEYHTRSQIEGHQNNVKYFRENVASEYGNVPPELEAANPFHPSVVVAKAVKADEKIAERAGQVKAFLQDVLLPPPPADPKVLAELKTQKERDEYQQARVAEWQARSIGFSKKAYDMVMAYQLIPSLTKRISELEARLTNGKPNVKESSKEDEETPDDEVEAMVKDPRKFVPKPFKL